MPRRIVDDEQQRAAAQLPPARREARVWGRGWRLPATALLFAAGIAWAAPEIGPERVAGVASELAPDSVAFAAPDAPSGIAPAPPSDSVRLAGPVRLRGGEVLSIRDVRARLPVDPRGGWRARGQLEDGLAGLGALLLAAGHLESRLELIIDSLGCGVLTVDDGPAARWDSLAATSAIASPFPMQPRPDARYESGRLERGLRAWVDLATERGYPFAAARIESLQVSGGRVRAGVRLDAGPYCRVEEITFPGRTVTRESFLRRLVGFRAGMPFRESDWRGARRRLEQVGLFTMTGEPRVELRPAGGVQVVLPVEEAKHNRVEGAVGYSGRTRTVTGLVDLQLGNLLGTGRRLAIRWERPQKEQTRLRLEARDPVLGPLPVGARFALEQEVRDSTYTTVLLELVGEVSLARDFTALAGAEWRQSILGPEPAERHRRTSSVFGGRWDTERPGAWSGGRLETTYRSGRTQVRPPGGGAESSLRLDRADVSTERYVQVGGLVARLRFLGAAVSRADSLPPSEVLRFGGRTTLRGYADESLLARRYATGQLELGPAWAEARAYVFLDAAFWRASARRTEDHDALGFGLGLSQQSSGRRVSIDLAIPRGGDVADGRLHAQVEQTF